MLGHSKEIITADVYGDTIEIIEDCCERKSVDLVVKFLEVNNWQPE